MRAIGAEFRKLKRSLSWTVVVLFPAAMVIAGAVNTIAAGQQPADGWHTIWLRSVVFYGLFPLAIGMGILASLTWRAEHRGGNWNNLMSGPLSSLRIVTAKATVVAVLAACMQAVLLVVAILVGKLVFGLPGILPGEYWLTSVLIVVACVPVAVLQSGLSMLMRSFAAPVAVAFLGAGASVALLLANFHAAIFVIPYALIGRTTQLCTGTFADSGTIAPSDIISVVIAAAILSAISLASTAAILDRRDIRT